jgi:hypothetical protein
VRTIRVALGEPLVTGLAMTGDRVSGAGHPVGVAVAASGRTGTTGISSRITKQMGV